MEIKVEICRKDVKRLTLRKRPGEPFRLSVPLATSQQEIDSFLSQQREWMQRVLAKEQEREPEQRPSAEQCRAFYEQLPTRFNYWQDRMGLRARKVTVKWMQSRWGSCSSRSGHISISFMLANVRDELIDYVIVHELAHLRHPDHSPQFWELVAIYCPDYQLRRATLNRRHGLNPYR